MTFENDPLGSKIPKLVLGSNPPATKYDVDIIILMQNRLAETIEAVNSSFQQQNVSFHVTVLDQGSSEEVRDRFIDFFKDRDHFGYYIAPVNMGVGGGRNYLSALGSGTYIVALDNDAIFADDLVIARAAALFTSAPALGVIAFKILSRDGINLEESSWGYPQGLKTRANEDFVTTTFVGAGHAIRRAAWTEVGGYDADLFFTWEEYDFSLRAIALHWRIMYAGSLAVVHKVAAEARIHWNSERTKLFVRNRVMIGRKWNVSWFALLPRIFGYQLKAVRNRRLLPALSGLFEAIKRDRSLLKKTMSPNMQSYVYAHEVRYHKNLVRNLYHHVIVKQQADPKLMDSGVLNAAAHQPTTAADFPAPVWRHEELLPFMEKQRSTLASEFPLDEQVEQVAQSNR